MCCVTVREAADALGLADENYVQRLVRSGLLRATKVRGRWDVDAESVLVRQQRIAGKRSSAVHRLTERAERKADAAARYAT